MANNPAVRNQESGRCTLTWCLEGSAVVVPVVVPVITVVALFIIGCIGAAGAVPGPTIGWAALGVAAVGGAISLISLVCDQSEQRNCRLILMAISIAIFVTIGALGGTGILSGPHVGSAILGTLLARCLLGGRG